MSCTPPKQVAILLATYNGEKYILELLESIANQTFQDFCCYIHDDGSKDSTMDLVLHYCKCNPEQFKYVEGPSCGGAKSNFFFLMENIGHEQYVMFADQDDYWKPEKIATSLSKIKELEKNKSRFVCVYSDLEVVDSNMKTICSSFYKYSGKNPYKNDIKSIIMTNVVVGCTMMINRELLDKSLELKQRDLLFMHDWWIALIAALSGTLIYIDKPLIRYRQHNGNVVGAIEKKGFLKRIHDFICFRNYQTNKARMKRSVNFSKCLVSIGLKTKNAVFLKGMSMSDNWSWIHRVVFFLKVGLIPLGKIWKIIWL